MTTPMPDLGMIAILPELVLALLACLVFVMVPFVPKEKRDLLGYFSIGALVVSGLLIIPLGEKPSRPSRG
ncbi:MAG: hypothetical protein MPW14_10375 [Candidatus Manganitrophus sp.]|nr:MAG: hypothetical protein MPW14_10375 [Candidatus Manganitrophus sp.]